MVRSELIEGYESGKLSRRAFVRGMTALGMSVAAANLLADNTDAASSSQSTNVTAETVDDVYDDHHHHHHGHSDSGTGAVVALPNTGVESDTGNLANAKVLGILGSAAVAAAAFMRRTSRNLPEND